MPNLQNLKPFKPGQSGNPNGRPKMRKDLHVVQKLSQTELEAIFHKYAQMPAYEVMQLVKDGNVPFIDHAVLTVMQMCHEKNIKAVELLMNRMVGKVKDVQEVHGEIKQVQSLEDHLKQRLEEKNGPAV